MQFYFDVRDGVPVRDKVGREFKLASEAIEFSKTFARTLQGPGQAARSESVGCQRTWLPNSRGARL